jgi:hypothetical protein
METKGQDLYTKRYSDFSFPSYAIIGLNLQGRAVW